MDEIGRMHESLARIEARQDGVLRDISSLSHHLETRIDRVGERIEESRAQSSNQYVALSQHFDGVRLRVDEKLEDFDETILRLGVKTGAELGKVKGAADSVEKTRQRWRSVVSGDVLVRYRLFVWIVLLLAGLIYGWGLVQFVARLLGIHV